MKLNGFNEKLVWTRFIFFHQLHQRINFDIVSPYDEHKSIIDTIVGTVKCVTTSQDIVEPNLFF